MGPAGIPSSTMLPRALLLTAVVIWGWTFVATKVLVAEGQVRTKEEPEIPKPSPDAEDSLSQQAALTGGSR